MKSQFYLQKKSDLLALIESTITSLHTSDDFYKVDFAWLLAEINRIKSEVTEDTYSSKKSDLGVFSLKIMDDLIKCDKELWLNVRQIGNDYRKLQKNL